MQRRTSILVAATALIALAISAVLYLVPAGGADKAPAGQVRAAGGEVWMALDPIAPSPLPRIVGGTRAPGRPLVVIDPGHGGHDPGTLAAGGRVREKDVALGIALAIRDALVLGGRVRVALTREDDRYLTLPERVALAKRLGAGLLVSIHADSAPNAGARGASVYTASDIASDREAARLAAKENAADLVGGVALGGEGDAVRAILADLAQRETVGAAASFATLLRRAMPPAVRVRHNFRQSADFSVLRSDGLPAVLLETGYLSNRDDAAFLESGAGRRAIAEGVRKAIEVHFARLLTSRGRSPPEGRAGMRMGKEGMTDEARGDDGRGGSG